MRKLEGNQIDPKMDMTLDMDIMKGSRGITYFMTTVSDIPKELFRKYVEGRNFLDIGCGDGRMLKLAMISRARKYRGIEIDQEFIDKSEMKRFIVRGDFNEVDLSRFDVLYYFLGSDENGEEKLLKNLETFEGNLIIYSRKVEHRLQSFSDNLENIGFMELESEGFIRIYRRSEK